MGTGVRQKGAAAGTQVTALKHGYSSSVVGDLGRQDYVTPQHRHPHSTRGGGWEAECRTTCWQRGPEQGVPTPGDAHEQRGLLSVDEGQAGHTVPGFSISPQNRVARETRWRISIMPPWTPHNPFCAKFNHWEHIYYTVASRNHDLMLL